MIEDLLKRYLDERDSDRMRSIRASSQFCEAASGLLEQYIDSLKGSKQFSEIPSRESLSITAYDGYRADLPSEKGPLVTYEPFCYRDLIGDHPKAGETARRIMLFPAAGDRPELQLYRRGKSLELFVLETGNLVEFEIDSLENDFPTDPSSQSYSLLYRITRAKSYAYSTPAEAVQDMDLQDLKSLLYLAEQSLQPETDSSLLEPDLF